VNGKKETQPEEMVAKLRQVESLRLRGKTCAEAVRSIGVSEVTYRRWRAEFGGLIRTLGPNHASVEKPPVT
jgi:putative transposase